MNMFQTRLNRRQYLAATLSGIALASCGRAMPAPRSLGAGWMEEAFVSLSGDAEALVKSREAAGISIGISNGTSRFTNLYGHSRLAPPVRLNAQTAFRIASVTKPLTAALTLRMIEAGELSLTHRVAQYFPDFPKGAQIGVHELLVHTSGLPNWWDILPENTPDDALAAGQAHAWFAKMSRTSDFAPGTKRFYSNTGYVLLGEMLERAADKPIEQLFDEYIFQPCGMEHSEMERMATQRPNWSEGYVYEDGDLSVAPPTPLPFTAGGLRSTVDDLLAFSDKLFGGGLLRPDMLAQMTAHQRTSDGTPVGDAMYVPPGESPVDEGPDVSEMGYGYGVNTWVQEGERFYSHSGLINGFSSYWIHAPRVETTMVVLCNTQSISGDLNQSFRDFVRAAK